MALHLTLKKLKFVTGQNNEFSSVKKNKVDSTFIRLGREYKDINDSQEKLIFLLELVLGLGSKIQ